MVKVEVEVMHISTGNIWKIVTESKYITIAIKKEVVCGISIGIFTFDVDQL